MYSRASASRKWDEHCWGNKRASEKDGAARNSQVHKDNYNNALSHGQQLKAPCVASLWFECMERIVA